MARVVINPYKAGDKVTAKETWLRYGITEGDTLIIEKVDGNYVYINGETFHCTHFAYFQQPAGETKESSDGGSTSYYGIPPGATDLADLIEHKEMNFNRGNIFKAAYRLGQKSGTEEEYDLKKIIYFAERELKRIKKRGK